MTETSALGFIPDWPLPANVRAFVTHRHGGGSGDGFSSNNLALHVGDAPETVARNRQALLQALEGLQPPSGEQKGRDAQAALHCQWLRQVHGPRVATASRSQGVLEADGCITTERRLACAVMTADCVPLLMTDEEGARVAAVHAGWRGLVSGIIGEAVRRMETGPERLSVFIGPAICQQCYEVNTAVQDALLATVDGQTGADISLPVTDKPGHFLVDLAAIAKAQLRQRGVNAVYGGDICNSCDRRFYSFRRHRQDHSHSTDDTGRFASLIWRV